MPAPSLFALAKTRLIQNISLLEDVGDLPYSFLAPVLRHIQVPDQLATLEANCPQLVGETGDIWLRLIKRDIPGWEKKPHEPQNKKNWSKVYKKLKKEAEAEQEAQNEALRQKMQALKKDRSGNQTTIINANLNLPSARRTHWSVGGGRSSGWGDPTAPKKTGKVAFDKLRRGMYDAKRARPKGSNTPMHILNERKKTVTNVPASMIRIAQADAADQARQRIRAPPATAPTTPSVANGTRRPPVHQTPLPRLNDAAPERAAPPERVRLPAGHTFSAPRPVPRPQPSTSNPTLKRPRPGPSALPSVLVESKRRRV